LLRLRVGPLPPSDRRPVYGDLGGGPLTPTVVVVGAASRDIVADDPRGWRLGGGVTYGALTIARLGVRTAALVGVDAAAERADELDLLRDAGVEVVTVRLTRGPVFENIETPRGRIQIGSSPADRVPPRAMPRDWAGAPGWLFAAVADELADDWAAAVPAGALVATGWQGLLRDVTAGERVRHRAPHPSPIVARSDIIGVSRDDLEPDVPLAMLSELLHPGATLLLTQGSNGGIAMAGGPGGPMGMRRWPGIAAATIVDPTGAGDVFLAALLAARVEPRLTGGRPGPHLDFLLAAAAASLVIEAPGLLGVPSRDAVRHRIADAPPSRPIGPA